MSSGGWFLWKCAILDRVKAGAADWRGFFCTVMGGFSAGHRSRTSGSNSCRDWLWPINAFATHRRRRGLTSGAAKEDFCYPCISQKARREEHTVLFASCELNCICKAGVQLQESSYPSLMMNPMVLVPVCFSRCSQTLLNNSVIAPPPHVCFTPPTT